MAKKKARIPTKDVGPAINQPFAALAKLREQLADAPATDGSTGPDTGPGAVADPPSADDETKPDAGTPMAEVGGREKLGSKVVLRREKKGRGGKTMTRVTGLELGADALERLAKEMKRALGCGAAVEGADILLQGSQAQRAKAFVEKRGVRRVIIGN